MHTTWLRQLLAIYSILAISIAINRPVYKIILNSKGYAQFIQYDVDIPSLREFTLCVWVRVTSLESDQTIFTYIGNDDKRLMRLWLDSGGRQIRISLDHDRVLSSVEVDFAKGVWRDVCLSYQADFGAWALYIDAKLVSCEASRNLQGFEFPGEGSLIFGYGTSERGSPTGLTGEIYGASMILFSTIERNTNIRKEPWYRHKSSLNNKFTTKNKEEKKYIVLGDLKTDEIQTVIPLTISKERGNYHPHRFIQQTGKNIKMFSGFPAIVSEFNNKKINDFSTNEYHQSIGQEEKYLNQIYKDAIFKVQREFKKELTGSSTRDLPIVLEYETPPPVLASSVDYFTEYLEKNGKSLSKNHDNDIMLSDVEKPPPPEHDPKVYGQWTSSKFVGNVLNYLKSINFNSNKQQRKVPSTLNLEKFTDSYPYPSEFSYTKIRPPINFMKMVQNEKRHKIKKRDINGRQINVQIIRTDESNILESLTKHPDPKHVEITNRGEAINDLVHKTYQNNPFASKEKKYFSQGSYENHQLNATSNIFERHRGSNLLNILPFLKSKNHFIKDLHNQSKKIESYQDYSKSFSNENKWYHVKAYNNDQGLQQITDLKSHAEAPVTDRNRPTIRIKNSHDLHKQVQGSNEDSILNGRALAKEVSNQAKENIYNIPLLKFKHGFLPTKDPKMTTSNNIAVKVIDADAKMKNNRNNFNKHVKLGNALNEQFIIGNDERQIKNTFLGGDDTIPDINTHRSKWDSKSEDTFSSFGTRACKNIELYAQEDESIGKSKIVSPVHRTNIGIEFIEQSYKKCSMRDSSFKDSSLLLIDWIKTPVKLFGGANPKKTKDLCGFF